MTPDEFRNALADIGWSQKELARRLDSNESNIRQMARGYRPIPDVLATWLVGLAALLGDWAPPPKWNSRRHAISTADASPETVQDC
jgi:transcriptional regulator with XRE-family HTH domain